jgi:hypothetical protein
LINKHIIKEYNSSLLQYFLTTKIIYMKNLHGQFALTIIFSLLLLGCTKDNNEELEQLDIISEVELRGDNPKERPWQGTFEQQVVASYPIWCYDLEGDGNASHMGNVTASWSHCFNFDVGQYEGTGTIVAANGDEVNFNYYMAVVAVDAPSTYYFEGEYEITGGTGRFEGASGEGSAAAVNDASVGAGTSSLDGTIVY